MNLEAAYTVTYWSGEVTQTSATSLLGAAEKASRFYTPEYLARHAVETEDGSALDIYSEDFDKIVCTVAVVTTTEDAMPARRINSFSEFSTEALQALLSECAWSNRISHAIRAELTARA